MGKWKTRNDPSKPSVYGQHYQESGRSSLSTGGHRKASGSNLPPQSRNIESMFSEKTQNRFSSNGNSGSWKTMRSFRTIQEANEHKKQLAETPRRADQDFRVVKTSDPTYPFDVQFRKKSGLHAKERLVSKGVLPGEVAKERKEHPWASEKTAERIAADHAKKRSNNSLGHHNSNKRELKEYIDSSGLKVYAYSQEGAENQFKRLKAHGKKRAKHIRPRKKKDQLILDHAKKPVAETESPGYKPSGS